MAIGTNIGDDPIEFFDGMVDNEGIAAKKFTDADFSNEVILLSFIHVDYHDDTGHWMDNLLAIQNDVKVIAVIYNNTGTVTQFDVTKPGGCNFQLILNDSWMDPNYNAGGDSSYSNEANATTPAFTGAKDMSGVILLLFDESSD